MPDDAPKPAVFLSYATEDHAVAVQVRATLVANGIFCWMAPDSIVPGREWADQIDEGIRQARVLLVLVSGDANKSQHVPRELNLALNYGLFLFAVRVENVIPSGGMGYYLCTTHWFEANPPPVEQYFDALLKKVQGLLQLHAQGDQPRSATAPASPAGIKAAEQDEQIVELTRQIDQNPEDAGAYNTRGAAWYERGAYERALDDFSEAIRIDGTFATAWFNRGWANFQRREDARAITDFTRAIDLQPEYPAAYNSRGLVYHAQGKYSEAVADFTRAIERNPDDPRLYDNRGRTYDEMRKWDEAFADFSEAIRLDPKFASAYNSRAGARLLRFELNEAIEDLTEAIRLAPRFATAYRNRSFYHSLTKNFDLALADAREAVRLEPRNPASHESLGEAYARLDRHREAEAALNEALALDPESAEAWRTRGKVRRELGNLTGALEDFDHALQLKPTSAKAHCGRADVLKQLGKIHDAIAAYDAAIRADASSYDAFLGRGMAQEKVGRFDLARADYTEATRVSYGLTDALCMRGLLAYKQGDMAAALADTDEALERDSKCELAYVLRGQTYHEMGDDAQAIENFDQALSLRPNDDTSLFARAIGHERLGHLKEADRDFGQIIECGDRNVSSAHYFRSRVLTRMGQLDRARLELRDARRLDPDLGSFRNPFGRFDWIFTAAVLGMTAWYTSRWSFSLPSLVDGLLNGAKLGAITCAFQTAVVLWNSRQMARTLRAILLGFSAGILPGALVGMITVALSWPTALIGGPVGNAIAYSLYMLVACLTIVPSYRYINYLIYNWHVPWLAFTAWLDRYGAIAWYAVGGVIGGLLGAMVGMLTATFLPWDYGAPYGAVVGGVSGLLVGVAGQLVVAMRRRSSAAGMSRGVRIALAAALWGVAGTLAGSMMWVWERVPDLVLQRLDAPPMLPAGLVVGALVGAVAGMVSAGQYRSG